MAPSHPCAGLPSDPRTSILLRNGFAHSKRVVKKLVRVFLRFFPLNVNVLHSITFLPKKPLAFLRCTPRAHLRSYRTRFSQPGGGGALLLGHVHLYGFTLPERPPMVSSFCKWVSMVWPKRLLMKRDRRLLLAGIRTQVDCVVGSFANRCTRPGVEAYLGPRSCRCASI